MLSRKWITKWEPNDGTFWESQGKGIARRNLIFSIFAEFLGFSVWNMWTTVTVALALPIVPFAFKTGESATLIASQMLLLTAIPNLVGATLRLPYGAAVSIFGGRNWTVISAALLLIPTVMLAVAISDIHTSFQTLCIVAGLAGVGGGNFASSMANISHFYPDKKKGSALGLNAAGGNIGVAVVQFIVPAAIGAGVLGLVLGAGKAAGKADAIKHHIKAAAQPKYIANYLTTHGIHLNLANAGLVWIPFIVVATICAFFFMDNLAVSRASLKEQASILKRPHTWLMSVLYIGTFGSFLGYAASFGLLITALYDPTGVTALKIGFLGPLVGSLARPFGGWLSDRIGGTIVTFGNFVCMAAATLGLVMILRLHDPNTFGLFVATFLFLFVTTGIGNGSTYRMIPPLYLGDRLRAAAGRGTQALAKADLDGRREAAAALAFVSAIGAYGGFLIPFVFSTSFNPIGVTFKTPALQLTYQLHAAEVAFGLFMGFYVLCTVITGVFYLRTGHEALPAKVQLKSDQPSMVSVEVA
ncbi:MAG TPA: MFS transporter [Candidatus Dormibacteraeota bacterium]|jgi:NNP family nitrate/nitrite transporter-like MFS transporter|nr:MFS transporter [Candidatus Dormibacteraeota bacterium]